MYIYIYIYIYIYYIYLYIYNIRYIYIYEPNNLPAFNPCATVRYLMCKPLNATIIDIEGEKERESKRET